MKDSPDYEIKRVLDEMRAEYWRSLETEEAGEAGESRDYLVVRLGGERFGLPTTAAREVLRAPKLVRVPQVPEHIRGVVNLRGEILAVTDLCQVLGLMPAERDAAGRLVVVKAAGLTTALWTEAVEGIRSLRLAAVEPLTEGLSHLPREAIAGQVSEADGLLVLLDLEGLLGQDRFVVDHKGE
jgi:purine-binding chemotaxis protein CheW